MPNAVPTKLTKQALVSVGIPVDEPEELVGKTFRFIYQSGSSTCFVCGTITAVNLYGPGDVQVFISTPELRDGWKVGYLTYRGHENGWAAISRNALEQCYEYAAEKKLEDLQWIRGGVESSGKHGDLFVWLDGNRFAECKV